MKDFFKKLLIVVLTLEARLIVRRYKPKIVAITGSVGKTSTKDAIYAVLSQGAHVRKSHKSFNSEIGLPLTIIGVPNAWNNPLRWLQNLLDGLFLLVWRAHYPQWLVLEVGADRPGDIRSVAKWMPVTVAVITRLPEVMAHVEFFDSPQAVVEEKGALIDALVPDGTLVLYADDERAATFAQRLDRGHSMAEGAGDKKIITFGLSPQADVRAENLRILFIEGKSHIPLGMSAELVLDGARAPIELIGTVGGHTLLPALAAAAVGKALDKSIADIAQALARYEPPAGRMHLVDGVKDTVIIDDTYNSSPAAAVAALDTLAFINPSGRKIAVLGDMLELGRHSAEEHRKIGAYAARAADLLMTVGFRARGIAEGALDAGMDENKILQFEDAYKAGEELSALTSAGDCVLVKGSQSMRMEHTVRALMAEPERAAELLVRQDEEWRRR
ncbi:MAG: UDP-N-acetylmuramoyl-tripeptide--D-alanyl-D-alanine ligase [Patescibacteria group bacterium]|nr:UDP-N-acetylmuramoyl-tripeptide--D-alanyl-D-alanine ligase [Patescibacteria group bacterium]